VGEALDYLEVGYAALHHVIDFLQCDAAAAYLDVLAVEPVEREPWNRPRDGLIFLKLLLVDARLALVVELPEDVGSNELSFEVVRVVGLYADRAPGYIDSVPYPVLPIKNRLQDPGLTAAEQISTDFLQLVRFGLRRADDPLIQDSVRVVDAQGHLRGLHVRHQELA